MRVLILDGHPDEGRLLTELLDSYSAALPASAEVQRIDVRGLRFDPVLYRGYKADQPWEPDLKAVADAITACDHLVVGFPMWWGAEPAMLKGLLDRVLLPGFGFNFQPKGAFWDRLLVGRSADLIFTMDTPVWYFRLLLGDALVRRWRAQVLGFCGFKPVRVFRFGPTRRGEASRLMAGWQRRLAKAAAGVPALKRGVRLPVVPDTGTLPNQ
jgi:putative NADPH-quinone reductase